MKKEKFFLFAFFSLLFTFASCCKEGEATPNPDDIKDIVGYWYNEEANEETRFYKNGVLYCRHVLPSMCNELEGHWYYDKANKKLTMEHKYMGEYISADYTIIDIDKYYFSDYSQNTGISKCEKIVETYNLKVGDEAKITFGNNEPSYSIISYESKNKRLASVTSEGIIKAEGEKGTTYIKISTDKGNVWVRITVGDDCLDLWYDYVSLIDEDYDKMRTVLGNSSYEGENGYSFLYTYENTHNYISDVGIHLDSSTNLIYRIVLSIKKGTSTSKLLSYLDSHYYILSEDDEYNVYSSTSDLYASKAFILYDKQENWIVITDKQTILCSEDLWADLTPMFTKGKREVKTSILKNGYIFYLTDYSYSANGEEYYQISNNDYTNLLLAIYNTDNVLSEYVVYLKDAANINEVYGYLANKYTEDESLASNTQSFFYSDDESIEICLSLKHNLVIYSKLDIPRYEKMTGLWPDYSSCLNKSLDHILEQYGTPYTSENGLCTFAGHGSAGLVGFVIDNTQLCQHIMVVHKTSVDSTKVISYLDSLYTTYSKNADECEYFWINGSTYEESTILIRYKSSKDMVIYTPINSETRISIKSDWNQIETRMRSIEMPMKIFQEKSNIKLDYYLEPHDKK